MPTRVPEVVQIMHKHEKTQSQQDSIEVSTVPTLPNLTPSTTEESVENTGTCNPMGTSSREALIFNSSSSNPTTGGVQSPEDEYKNGSNVILPKIPPGVIPLGGHNGPSGWL